MDRSADRLRAPASEWAKRFTDEYLSDYIRSGGSVVKVVSGSDASLSEVSDTLRSAASRFGYYFSELGPAATGRDGKKPDLHRIDRFFLEATRDVDWKTWAAEEARRYLETQGIRVAPHRELNDLDGIAADNGRDATDLLNQYQREFATRLIRDHSLAIEFRTALTALSRAQLVPESMTPTTEEVLLGWFAGRTMPGASAALKRIHIFGRIDRSSARHMLASFCRWLPRTKRDGLVVVLDFRPYEHKRKTIAPRRKETELRLKEAILRRAAHEELEAIGEEGEAEPPVSYSNAAYQQMLQTLRRFIDETDWFERFCLVVLTSPGFYDGAPNRSYFDYDALQTRIGLEVHDATRANPVASLVHLEESK